MMQANLARFHRRSIRYAGYDYTQQGAYFVTIVTYHRVCIFGEVVEGEMKLNRFGQAIAQTCEWLTQQYTYVSLDPYIIMPNHIHAILFLIEDDDRRGGSRPAPPELNNDPHSVSLKIVKKKPLGQLIGAYKTVSAKQINRITTTPGTPVWQRNYYEHIIRDENELNGISMYILTNLQNWQNDREHLPCP